MAHRSSPAMVMRLGNLRTKSRSVWWESTFRSRCRWRSILHKVENDHEPLANRHSSWCRIRNANHVLIATTGPLPIQAAGTAHAENDDTTFVLRSNSRAFGKPDQKDIGRHP